MLRLTEHEIKAIKASVEKYDPLAKIYLFGSRTDLSKKGGDIDLLIFSQRLIDKDRINIKYELFKLIEEQKVDIIIAKDNADPFVKIALLEAILL